MDESGDPNGWNTQNNFVLGAVAIHEGQVYKLTKELNEIQASFFPKITVPLAFHATDIRRGKAQFKNIPLDRREEILNEVYEFIANIRFPNLVAFATAIHISAVKSTSKVLHDVLEDLCLRFNTFLRRQHKRGRTTKGLLIIDRAHEGHYRELFADFQKWGTRHGYLGNIIDIPYFARRTDTRMLQIADFCAYSVFRRYEFNDDKYLNKILNRFDRRAPGSPPDGLKHITEEDCSCQACSWRK